MEALKVSAKPDALIGQLRVMAATAPNTTVERYINQAVNAIRRSEVTESESQEIIGALELIAESCRCKEAGILRGAILELERIVEEQRPNIVYLPMIHVD